jgi:hypothetical protein
MREATYASGTGLFLRLLGVVYVVGFLSLAGQIPGLIGSRGILPAAEYLGDVRAWADDNGIGLARYQAVPTVFWLAASDRVLQGAAYTGVVLGALLALGVAPLAVLPLLWLLYLSLASVGREFLGYQWDTLLLETGLLAIALAPPVWRHRLRDAGDPPRIARWLCWWLIVRLMLGSGIVKLASGDPAWRDLTALAFHWETQPLPTPAAWYVHALPLAVHRASTALTLAIEIVVPLLVFTRFRRAAAAVLIGLQALIALTGNYGFFNLLSASLCVLLLDDGVFRRLPVFRSIGSPGSARRPAAEPSRSAASTARAASGRWSRWAPAAAAAVTLPLSVPIFAGQLGVDFGPLARSLREAAAPFRSVNRYGLFAVMTTRRLEIDIEGSLDGVEWRAYAFEHKPGALDRAPSWIAPFQPRLDWQMWFAALSRPEEEVWFGRFTRRLLEPSPPVLALMAEDPFAGQAPRYVRATLYQYRFTSPGAGETGAWWTRERLREYAAPAELAGTPARAPAGYQ